MIHCSCEHCNGELELVQGEVWIYQCARCGCQYRLCIIKRSEKCSTREWKEEQKNTKLVPVKAKKKRGRPRKIISEKLEDETN